MRNYTLFILLLLPLTSWGECNPDTVQFYLDKGFSQEQIAKLCSHSSSNAPKYQPYQKPVVIYQEGGYKAGVSAEERSAIKELKGSIAGRSVDVTDESISYIRNICVKAGNSKNLDERGEKCIDVAFSISRNDLRIIESGRGLLLFGDVEIEVVSSEIKRKTVLADPWSGFDPNLRFAFKRKYEASQKGNSTTIPIRRSASTGKVVTALKTIAAATDIRESEYESEVAKILDDDYVAPTEEEYAAAQPKPEVVEEEKKKKKRWWNPFD